MIRPFRPADLAVISDIGNHAGFAKTGRRPAGMREMRQLGSAGFAKTEGALPSGGPRQESRHV